MWSSVRADGSILRRVLHGESTGWSRSFKREPFRLSLSFWKPMAKYVCSVSDFPLRSHCDVIGLRRVHLMSSVLCSLIHLPPTHDICELQRPAQNLKQHFRTLSLPFTTQHDPFHFLSTSSPAAEHTQTSSKFVSPLLSPLTMAPVTRSCKQNEPPAQKVGLS